MTPEELQAIRERYEKAWPGPWYSVNSENEIVSNANAEFLAHVKEDIQNLLEEIARLEDAVQEQWTVIREFVRMNKPKS